MKNARKILLVFPPNQKIHEQNCNQQNRQTQLKIRPQCFQQK